MEAQKRKPPQTDRADDGSIRDWLASSSRGEQAGGDTMRRGRSDNASQPCTHPITPEYVRMHARTDSRNKNHGRRGIIRPTRALCTSAMRQHTKDAYVNFLFESFSHTALTSVSTFFAAPTLTPPPWCVARRGAMRRMMGGDKGVGRFISNR